MRLADDLARVRRLYPRPIATLPDLLLIDVPLSMASATLPLGRFYPVILETDEEHVEFEAFLSLERPVPVAPDLLDRRPSALVAADIVFALFDPDIADWPWVLLCHWPADHVALGRHDRDMFARGAYTVEIFSEAAARTAGISGLLATLGAHRPVQIVTPSGLPPAGSA